MNRSSSDLILEEFLQGGDVNTNPNFASDDVVVIDNPTAEVEPEEYALVLKKKLAEYCQAVALARCSGLKPQDSSLADFQSPISDSSHFGTQPPARENNPKPAHFTTAGGVLVLSAVPNTGATNGSSRELSDDDIEGEKEMTDNMDDVRRVKRMLSNRESARRSRRRKQAHLSELEQEVSRLRVENSSLLKHLTSIIKKYIEASAEIQLLRADAEALRAKIAEDSVKLVTDTIPMYPTSMSDISSINMTFSRSLSDATSNHAFLIKDDPNLHFHAQMCDNRMRTGNTEIVENATDCATSSRGNIGRSPSMQRVSSLEHLLKHICGGSNQT